MLYRVSYESLKRAAIYGAVLSVSGCSVLYYLIQKNLASSRYYTEAVQVLRRDKYACSLLGEPLRFQALNLRDRGNRVTAAHAQVLIPVSGTRAAGYLRSNATFRSGNWELDSVILEFKGRPQKLIIMNIRVESTLDEQ